MSKDFKEIESADEFVDQFRPKIEESIKRTKKTGKEHGFTADEKGKVSEVIEGEYSSLDLPSEYLMYHTHPGEDQYHLSGADRLNMRKMSCISAIESEKDGNITTICAIRNKYNDKEACIENAKEESEKRREAVEEKFREKVNDLDRSELGQEEFLRRKGELREWKREQTDEIFGEQREARKLCVDKTGFEYDLTTVKI